MKRRFLSMLIVLAMVLCLAPVTAFAEEKWTDIDDVSDLYTALGNGGNIRLTHQLGLQNTFTINKSVNLDLNGYTLELTFNEYANIARGGTLTVSDSNGNGKIIF